MSLKYPEKKSCATQKQRRDRYIPVDDVRAETIGKMLTDELKSPINIEFRAPFFNNFNTWLFVDASERSSENLDQ